MALMDNIQNSKVVRAYRQGYLAWLGAHKSAFDFAQEGVNKLMNGRDELVEDLVQKGEEVEGLAQGNIEKVRGYVEPRVTDVTARFNEVSEKVSEAGNKVFNRAGGNDRVEELSAEVAKLTKTVNALSRKVNTAKPAAKPAAKKAVAKKVVAKKAAAKPAVKKAAPAPKKAVAPKAAAPKAAPKAAAVEAKTDVQS